MPSLRDKRRDNLIKEARPALTPGEEVLDATLGMIQVRRLGSDTSRSGVILVTDRRVVLFTKKLGGYDVQDFAYGLLSSVDHKRGMTSGSLNLAAAGDRTHVRMIHKDDVERIARLIRDRMALAHTSAEASAITASAQVEDPSKAIRDLAALRDDGLITPEEFEAKKKQLLGL
ncbi:MAG TPA: PH domain-containing protein [Gaiellaceae bacterium]|nr:PH domain-containing protein [Gaiellaceae bacterium]